MTRIDTDEWLATMRSAWKAGIDRDEREEGAASTRRLTRAVAPEKDGSRTQPLRDVLPLAVCVGACVLGGIALRQAATAPSDTNGIRADEAQESPAPLLLSAPSASSAASAASASPRPSPSTASSPAAATAASSALPSMRPAPATPPKAKIETEELPPLPRPNRSEIAGAPSPPTRFPGRRDRVRDIINASGHRPPAPGLSPVPSPRVLPAVKLPRHMRKGSERDL